MKPRIERFVDRYAPVLANVVVSTLCACFWMLVTWLLKSSIWWLFGLLTWFGTFTAMACAQIVSEGGHGGPPVQ